MTITATIITLDTPTKNGRIYTKEVMEKAVNEYNKSIAERKALGEIYVKGSDRVYDTTVDLSNVSHIVDKLEIVDDKVIAEMTVLNTPRGDDLIKLHNNELIAFRPRGTGELTSNAAEGNNTVSNYTMISIDAMLKTDAA